MPKYEVIREIYERYEVGNLAINTFEAKDDVEALLKVCDHCGYAYYDEENRGYEDEGFVRPSFEELVQELLGQNGDGCDFVFLVKNLTTGSILLKDGYEEGEKNW